MPALLEEPPTPRRTQRKRRGAVSNHRSRTRTTQTAPKVQHPHKAPPPRAPQPAARRTPARPPSAASGPNQGGPPKIVLGQPQTSSASSTPKHSTSNWSAGPKKKNGFFASFTLEKSFTLFGLTFAAFLVIAFGLDLVLAWPFLRASVLFDVAALLCGLGLAYLSWDVLKDQLRGRTSR